MSSSSLGHTVDMRPTRNRHATHNKWSKKCSISNTLMGSCIARSQVHHDDIINRSKGNEIANQSVSVMNGNKKNALDHSPHRPPLFDQLGGHVFVLHGYLGQISCDAWMLPTDTNLRIDGWDHPSIHKCVKPCNWSLGIDDFPNKSDQRVLKCEIEGCAQNTPWLVLCSLTDKEKQENQLSVDWYIEGVRLFLEQVSRDLEAFARRLNCGRYSPAHGRSKPLVLIPVVGTGDGGGKDRTGEVIKKLLLELWSCSERLQLDIGVVTRQPYKVSQPFA
jgi:hypothetical protein